jgi:ABC-2 type transport system ATP-binding protein
MYLTFEQVTKFYGAVIGVNDVSFRLGPGITALFGSNGAGKSTLMKLASGQLRPTLGRVLIGEHSAWSSRAKRDIGYCPDINSFYEEMSGREFVYVMTRLYGYSRRESRERTEEALSRVRMTDRAHRKIAGYSHGMRQRIKLAQAMVNSPPIYLLDEPLTGIDPGGRREIHELLRELAADGKCVMVSTHLLSEIEDLADSILMIARGRVLASGTLAEIRTLLSDEPLTIGLEGSEPRRLAALLVGMEEVTSVDLRDEMVTARVKYPARFFQAFNQLVVSSGLEVTRLETLDAGADAVFAYLEPRGS